MVFCLFLIRLLGRPLARLGGAPQLVANKAKCLRARQLLGPLQVEGSLGGQLLGPLQVGHSRPVWRRLQRVGTRLGSTAREEGGGWRWRETRPDGLGAPWGCLKSSRISRSLHLEAWWDEDARRPRGGMSMLRLMSSRCSRSLQHWRRRLPPASVTARSRQRPLTSRIIRSFLNPLSPRVSRPPRRPAVDCSFGRVPGG